MVWGNNENNYNDDNIISDSKSNGASEENFFKEQIEDNINVTLKTILNPKVFRAIKNLKATYNAEANEIV